MCERAHRPVLGKHAAAFLAQQPPCTEAKGVVGKSIEDTRCFDGRFTHSHSFLRRRNGDAFVRSSSIEKSRRDRHGDLESLRGRDIIIIHDELDGLNALARSSTTGPRPLDMASRASATATATNRGATS